MQLTTFETDAQTIHAGYACPWHPRRGSGVLAGRFVFSAADSMGRPSRHRMLTRDFVA